MALKFSPFVGNCGGGKDVTVSFYRNPPPWGFDFDVALPRALRKIGQFTPWHMRAGAWLGVPGWCRFGDVGLAAREFVVDAGAPAPPRKKCSSLLEPLKRVRTAPSSAVLRRHSN